MSERTAKERESCSRIDDEGTSPRRRSRRATRKGKMNAANDKADDLAVEKGRKSPRRGSKLSREGRRRRRWRRRKRRRPPSVRDEDETRKTEEESGEAGVAAAVHTSRYEQRPPSPGSPNASGKVEETNDKVATPTASWRGRRSALCACDLDGTEWERRCRWWDS